MLSVRQSFAAPGADCLLRKFTVGRMLDAAGGGFGGVARALPMAWVVVAVASAVEACRWRSVGDAHEGGDAVVE